MSGNDAATSQIVPLFGPQCDALSMYASHLNRYLQFMVITDAIGIMLTGFNIH